MKYCGQIIIVSTICSIIGIITISIISNIDLSRTSSTDFVIATLSLLVTILLGWNIYTLIDFKNKINKAKTDYDKLANEIENINQLAYDANIQTYYTLYQFYIENNKPAGAITALIMALSKMVDIDLAENHKTGNIKRFSNYLSETIKNNKNSDFLFGEINIPIIEADIKKIKNNKDYHYIKDKFDESFIKIDDMISKEKSKSPTNH